MVADQPTFEQRWPEVLDAIAGLPVVAHNAAFDMNAVGQACAHSGVTVPTWHYGCTLVWAKRQLPLPKHGLKPVAEALGIALHNHHDAGSDAAAAADIAVGLATRTGVGNLAELARVTGTRLGHISPAGNRGCR
jgi:DNA polymerase-3 subunit epsilon